MAQQIQWEKGRYGGVTGTIDLLGAKVNIATLSQSTKRGNNTWEVRVDLPGYRFTGRNAPDLETGKAQVQRTLDIFAKEIS